MARQATTQQDPILARIASMRQDRNIFAARINRFYELAMPQRQRVGTSDQQKPSPGEQDDIFDATLQDTTEDFGSDMQDAFTPHYQPWVKVKPGRQLKSSAEEKAFGEAIKKWQDVLYSAIRASNFYAESQENWSELAIAPSGLKIPYAPVGKRILVQPIMAANFLMDTGPNGEIDARFAEWSMKRHHLKTAFPGIAFDRDDTGSGRGDKVDEMVSVQQGCYRDYNARGEAVWMYCVYLDGEKKSSRRFRGKGAEPIAVLRWRGAPPSPWGPGPGDKAMPSAGALNELNYLTLKQVGKQVDPPLLYDDDGTFNPEEGINAGESYARMPGMTFDFLVTEQDLRTVFFEQEDLRMQVRRALYQDKPFQRGDTPPTASQWLDEKARTDKRLQLARLRIYDEFVIPVLQRFAWILARRGELPKLEIDGEIVEAEFINPVSRASDLDAVNRGNQLLTIGRAALGEQFGMYVDGFQTMENFKEKLGDELVVFKPYDPQQAALMEAAAKGKPNGGANMGQSSGTGQ